MRHSKLTSRLGRPLLMGAIGLVLTGCGSATSTAPGATVVASAPNESQPAASPSGSQTAEPAGGTTSGDIPDNAVFLTYHGTTPGFSIQYVEGWQVTPQPDGVVVRDKDSSESVTIVAPQADVAGYVASTDLPALRAQAGFALIKQDSVKVGDSSLVHLTYHQVSPPDPVTGKQVPQTVDRYYVPGPSGLAMVSLATPNGVDNVDAFRQMIESFKWS